MVRVAVGIIAQRDGEGTAVHVLPYRSPMAFSGGEVHGAINDLRGQLAHVDAGLVVMGVSRRSRFDELIFGSMFRKVLRQSRRPILAIPVAGGNYRWSGEPAAIQALTEGRLRAA